ncbi:hypothetical protein HY837_05015 [archaeon]|nr:hypothetical protein [archaeon]
MNSFKTVNGGKILFWDIPYQNKIDDIINRADKEALIDHVKPNQFGESVAERVIGWDRVTYPWDFMFNPLAK